MAQNAPGNGEDQQDRRSRRRRLLAAIGRIRRRVNQVCGVVEDADSLIQRSAEIAGEIRSILESPELRALLPASAHRGLETSAGQLDRIQDFMEQVGDRSQVAAEVCDHLNDALDVAEAALQGPSQWGRLADRSLEWIGGLSIQARIGVLLAGVAAVIVGAIGLTNAFGGDVGEPEVFGVFMLSPALSMEVGESLPLGVRVEAEGGVDVSDRVEISWTTDNPSVGQITAGGDLQAVSPGVVGVTVEAAGFSDYREFTVEGGALPDLVVTLNEPVFVDCLRGICTHSIVVLVTNNGDADAGRSTVAVELDGLLSAEEFVGALAAGGSTEVQLTFEPGESCYNPQCEVVAVVDGSDMVEESDEDNNNTFTIFGG